MPDGELGIYWGYRRISHPLERTPAVSGGGQSGQTIKLGKGMFAVPLPEDAPPTGTAVHTSLVWFLEAALMNSKWTQGIEKVRRQIVVVNAP